MSGSRHRRKGDAIERELVHRHRDIGIRAERYPLSGASRFRGSGHDVDIYIFGPDTAPAVAEVKALQHATGDVYVDPLAYLSPMSVSGFIRLAPLLTA